MATAKQILIEFLIEQGIPEAAATAGLADEHADHIRLTLEEERFRHQDLTPEQEQFWRQALSDNRDDIMHEVRIGMEQAKKQYLDSERKRLLKKNRSRGRR